MGADRSTFGNQIVQTQYCPQNYVMVDRGYCRVWKHIQTGTQDFEEYDVFLQDQQMVERYKKMCYLRTNNPNLVKTHYFTHKKHQQFCGTLQKGTLVAERIHYRLSDFRLLSYQELLHVLLQVLDGLQILYTIYGPFRPLASMIAFHCQQLENDFKIKIWHNSIYSALMPQFPNHTSLPHMLNDLVKCIQMHGKLTKHSKLQLFSAFLNQPTNVNSYHKFSDFKLALMRYIRYNRLTCGQGLRQLKQKMGLKFDNCSQEAQQTSPIANNSVRERIIVRPLNVKIQPTATLNYMQNSGRGQNWLMNKTASIQYQKAGSTSENTFLYSEKSNKFENSGPWNTQFPISGLISIHPITHDGLQKSREDPKKQTVGFTLKDISLFNSLSTDRIVEKASTCKFASPETSAGKIGSYNQFFISDKQINRKTKEVSRSFSLKQLYSTIQNQRVFCRGKTSHQLQYAERKQEEDNSVRQTSDDNNRISQIEAQQQYYGVNTIGSTKFSVNTNNYSEPRNIQRKTSFYYPKHSKAKSTI